jgi:hypothetical protein
MEAMVWTHDEALERAHDQIGVSQCGATALLSVAAALRLATVTGAAAAAAVSTRVRNEKADAISYLVSRSVAGCLGSEIALGGMELFPQVDAMFAHLPSNPADLSATLRDTIRSGAVAVVTLNPQARYLQADAWHHQFIYGVDSRYVYLTNPIEAVPMDTLVAQTSCDSVLRVRCADLLRKPWALPGYLTSSDFRGDPATLEATIDAALEASIAACRGPVPQMHLWRSLGVPKQLAGLLLTCCSSVLIGTNEVATRPPESDDLFDDTSGALHAPDDHIVIPASCKSAPSHPLWSGACEHSMHSSNPVHVLQIYRVFQCFGDAAWQAFRLPEWCVPVGSQVVSLCHRALCRGCVFST